MKKLLFSTLCCLFFYNTSQGQNLETVIQQGHNSSILCADFSPDDNFILTGSEDKTIKLWDLKSGQEIRTFSGHASAILDVKYSSDGKFFASAGRDYTVKIWDPVMGEAIKTLRKHKKSVSSIDISPDGKLLVSVSSDRMGYIWDIESEEIINEFKVKSGQYGPDVSFSSDGQYIALGGDNGEVLIINSIKLDTIFNVRELDYSSCGGCYSKVAFSTDLKYFLTAADKGPLILWDFKTGNKIQKYVDKWETYTAIGITSDDRFIYASDENEIILWNVRSGNVSDTLQGHKKDINFAVSSNNGQYLLSVGNDNKAILWDIKSGSIIKEFKGSLSAPVDNGLDLDPDEYWESYAFQTIQLKNKFEFLQDDNFILKSNLGKNVTIWNWKSGSRVRELRGHNKAVICYDTSPDGKYIVTGSGDRSAILWDVNTGDSIRSFSNHYYVILDVEISHNGKYLATAGYDGYTKIWDIHSGELIQQIRLSQDPQKIDSPFTLAFSPNDLYIVTGSTGEQFIMWEIDSGKPFKTFMGHTRVVSSIEFFKSEGKMLSGSWDNSIRLWDYRTGYQERKFSTHTEPVNDIAILSSGSRFVSGSTDRTALLWDINTGEILQRFIGHKSAITSVGVTRDEKYLVTGSIEGTLKIWDLESGEELISHYFIGENDWMVKNKAGYFHATQGMQSYIHFVNGMETFNIDQFFEQFYTPDIMEQTFSSTRKIEENIIDQLEKSPPPNIAITFPEDGSKFQKEGIDVLVKVTNTGGGIDEVKLLHNGKRISEDISALDKPQKKGKSVYQTYGIKLISGQNTFRASAFSKERIESRSVENTVIFEGAGNPANCYVLVVGINKYQNPKLNLNYARADAEDFADMMRKSQGSLFNKVEVLALYDKDATKERILEYLDFVAKQADPSDVFFFYYAGHGSMMEENFYFIPTECVRLYEKGALDKTAIYAGEMQDKFKRIQALKQVVIVDACQSGGSAELLAMRGAGNEKAIAQLSRSAGVHVLASAGSEQFAAEFEELGHGIFTYVLLDAMKGKADGSPRDGKVTIFELKSYLDSMVPELSEMYKGKPQYPYTFSRGHDFPLIMEKE